MKLAAVRLQAAPGSPRVAAADSSGWRLLDATLTSVSDLLQAPSWPDLTSGEQLEEEEIAVFDNPLPSPSKVICCGLNYRNHILEMGRELPEHPTLFAKYADTLIGPGDQIRTPEHAKLDWEAELGVVVGREIYRADRDEAAEAITGYTVANDISMRDWQRRTLQWFQGKAHDATTPIGPVVVTTDAVDPAAGLRIICEVNGETVQDSTTDQLVFDSSHLLSYISGFTRLRPGDLVLTGTPGGVGMGMEPPKFLSDGDVLTTTVEGIGTLTNTVIYT